MRSVLGANFMEKNSKKDDTLWCPRVLQPSGSREREQQHKFDPMGIPGVFAGYSIGPGLHWSRKYRVWALCDWSKQNLAYDAEKPIAKLRTPHYTERVELKEPLEFPCKSEYERINVSIEGLKVKDRLEGNPEIPTATATG